jgi:hypothetical protein
MLLACSTSGAAPYPRIRERTIAGAGFGSKGFSVPQTQGCGIMKLFLAGTPWLAEGSIGAYTILGGLGIYMPTALDAARYTI